LLIWNVLSSILEQVISYPVRFSSISQCELTTSTTFQILAYHSSFSRPHNLHVVNDLTISQLGHVAEHSPESF